MCQLSLLVGGGFKLCECCASSYGCSSAEPSWTVQRYGFFSSVSSKCKIITTYPSSHYAIVRETSIKFLKHQARHWKEPQAQFPQRETGF